MAEQTQMLSYVEAMNVAFKEEMRRDKSVVLWGVDLVSMDGNFNITLGIADEFKEDRIIDTPISEVASVETAVGAALTGLRPVAILQFAAFLPLAGDGVLMKAGSYCAELGHGGPLPLVINAMIGGSIGCGADHALSTEALLIHSPGLKVVLPSTPYDAKGLLKAAIRDDYPVIYMPHIALYFGKGPVPTEDYIVPLGKADVKRDGTDATIVTYSAMVVRALAAAEALSKEGISVEVVDLRSLVPLDVEAIVESVKKTGRLLIVHEAMKRGGVAGEIAFRVNETAPELVKTMKAPIKRLAAQNVGLPRSLALEQRIVPQVDDIVKAVKEIV